MVDKRCFALLNAINSLCNSGYKIFSFEELCSLMPVRLGLDVEGVKESLKSLSDHELISIKYFGESEVCLRPLIKGRVAIENKTDKDIAENSLKKRLMFFAFLGGLFGGIACGVIFLLAKLIGGV